MPDLVILHSGGNDIGNIPTIDLLFEMKKNITRVRQLFPDAVVIFSEIIPRLICLEGCSLYRFSDKIWERLNRAVAQPLDTWTWKVVCLDCTVEIRCNCQT